MKTEEQRQDEARSTNTLTLLEEAREAAHEDTERVAPIHTRAKERIKFVAGDQWDPIAKAERNRERRPVMVFPKLNQFIDSVYGSMLQQRPAITVLADDQIARRSKALVGGKRVEMARARAGLMRKIDSVNHAQIAYLNAYEGALSWGFGHWRYRLDYKPYSFDQVIVIEPVWDPFSVVWDAASMDVVNRDARRCWLFSELTKKEFEAEYPGVATTSYAPDPLTSRMGDWVKGDSITIAEWFVKRPKTYRLCELSDGRVVRWDDKEEQIRDELAKAGVTIKRHRPDHGHVVVWHKMAGMDLLEDPIELPGEHIPVVTCWGRRLLVDGSFQIRCLIEHAMDEQRAYNYGRTRAIEAVALAPLAPFIIGSSQIKGMEKLWKVANTKSLAALTYDDSKNVNPPQRSSAATDLSGIREIIQVSEQGLMSATGRYEASQGMRSNEQSGRAVLARAQQGDQVTEPFEENYRYALTQGGCIVNDWLPEVYRKGMTAQILNEDNTEDTVTLGHEEIVDEQTGETVILNDLSAGRYAVKIDTAPEYNTQRQESVQGMTEFAQAFPSAAPALAPEVIRISNIPNAERAAAKVEAMLPPEVRAAGEGEEDELPPQVQAMVEQAQGAMQQAQMMVAENQAALDKATADAEALKRQLQAEKEAHQLALDKARIQYDRKMLETERRLFQLEQRITEPSEQVA